MEKKNDILEKIATAKIWSEILSDSLTENTENSLIDVVDPDNYVSRMNSLVLEKNNKQFETLQLDKIILDCDGFVKNNSQLQNYKSIENENLIRILDKDKKLNLTRKNTEILDLSEFDNKDSELRNGNNSLRKQKIETNISGKNEDKSIVPQARSNDNLIRLFNSIKLAINDNMNETIKILLVELLLNYNLDMIEQFCHNLIDIENPVYSIEEKKITNLTLKEKQLSSLILNLSPAQISYKASSVYLKNLLGDYVLIRSRSFCGNNQLEEFYSRVIMDLFEYLLKDFSQQFIISCLTPWAIESNSANNQENNGGLTELMLKIINEHFHENESSIMLSFLMSEKSNSFWSERFYAILISLIEKGNLSYENMSLLISKMQQDSSVLKKSSIFSKCLLLVLNKLKTGFSENDNKRIQSTVDPNEIVQLSQPQADKIVNMFPIKIENNLLNAIEIIIENNQTIMKKTLLKILNIFKS